MLHRIGLDADAEEELREREAFVTQAAPGRSTEALCAAYGMLGRARRRYQIALGIPNTILAQAPGPKTRWAWECAYPTPYEPSVRAREAADGLPAGLIFAVMRQESNFDPEAVSPARAIGLMQLLPETAKTVAEGALLAHEDARLTSPPYNIALGSIYLHELLEKFRGTVPLAVGGYNGGPDAIARWASRSPGMDLDVFVERIPFVETRVYVGRVMGNLARYAYLKSGEAGVPKIALALP
jgi:soluble lytic murein transglycosylase